MPTDQWYSDPYYSDVVPNNANQSQGQYRLENINTTSADTYVDDKARRWYRIDPVQFKDLEKHGKINAIKHLREIFGISLVQAKDIIDGVTCNQRQIKAKELIADKLKEVVKDAYNLGLAKAEVTKLLELTPW